MAQHFDARAERMATASAELGAIQAGWTVYDAKERPVGNATDVEGGRLRVDGRPEGLGFFEVPADAVRSVSEGSVQLSLDVEQIRAAAGLPTAVAGSPAQAGESPGAAEPSGSVEPPASRTEFSAAGGRPVTGSTEMNRPDELSGSSYTASGTPVGFGSNTPVGQEGRGYQDWDAQAEGGSVWSKLALLATPAAIGTAGAAAYVWWRNRQQRRGRLARVKRALAAAGSSARPALEAAGERKRGGWLLPLVALPLLYYLRSARSKSVLEEVSLPALPTGWKDRLPSAAASLSESVEAPPLWTVAIPVAGAGLVAAWFARRSRQASTPGRQRLGDIMTREVQVVRPDTTLFEAASLMKRLNVGSVPVCDGRRLQGFLTDRDIVVRAVADSRDPQLATAQDAMTANIVYAFDTDTVAHGAELMRQHQVRRLPIVDQAKNLVGIVSLGDLALDTGSDRLSGETLERISAPSRPRR